MLITSGAEKSERRCTPTTCSSSAPVSAYSRTYATHALKDAVGEATERERDTHRPQAHRHTDTDTDTETDTDTQAHRHTDTERQRDIETAKHRCRDRDRQRRTRPYMQPPQRWR